MMAQRMSHLANWLVTDNYRDKAQIKYELKYLESRLCWYFYEQHEFEYCPDEVKLLCERLICKYKEYLKLIDDRYEYTLIADETHNWRSQYHLILELRRQLAKAVSVRKEIQLINELISLYYHLKNASSAPLQRHSFYDVSQECLHELRQLFKIDDLESWLIALVEFWNQYDVQKIELSLLFHEWGFPQQQQVLDFFADPQLVNLINALFFYKVYPEKLFNEFIHPEKLVSVRVRLGLLHHYIETLQQQSYSTAMQYGLKPNIDYLFHGDELPQGIMIDVHEEFTAIIQSSIKHLKIKSTTEDEEQVTIERLHDLGRAYKFWFNPNRLIDAVMVLQQRLVKNKIEDENNLLLFHQEMIILFGQLTTTECLDLYGYFSNNDSRYLLYTLFIIFNEQQSLDWLPSLNHAEQRAIADVFHALQCVMEALRVELKHRQVTTEPYVYDLAKQCVHAGRRNREAVLRVIMIYGRESISTSNVLEKLFNDIEELNK